MEVESEGTAQRLERRARGREEACEVLLAGWSATMTDRGLVDAGDEGGDEGREGLTGGLRSTKTAPGEKKQGKKI